MKVILSLIATLMLPFIAWAAAPTGNWALPHVSVAHVRAEPRHGAEMVTQALMGMPLRVLNANKTRGWVEVEMPDGYTGFVIANSLTMMPDSAMTAWRNATRVIVSSIVETKAYVDTLTMQPLTDLVDGDILQLSTTQPSARWRRVVLPDGRRGWVMNSVVTPLDRWASAPATAANILSAARAHMGTVYLWGGLTSKGMDCSGLVKLATYHCGIILPRDAWQQALEGEKIASTAQLRPGDLLFFGNSLTGKVTHVAIYQGNGVMVESSGRVKSTRLKGYPGYLGARRILGHEGTGKIVRAAKHPWYFN